MNRNIVSRKRPGASCATQPAVDKFEELKSLLPVVVNDKGLETVDGRNLQAGLGNSKDYTDWAKQQIARARLVEKVDFEVFPLKGVNPSGGRPRSEYAFSVPAAKKIAMMAESEKGNEVRDYFLRCEELAKQVKPKAAFVLPDFEDPIAAARAWADAKEGEKLALARSAELDAQIEYAAKELNAYEDYVEEIKPQLSFCEEMSQPGVASIGFRDFCKKLLVKEPEFRAWLLREKITFMQIVNKKSVQRPHKEYVVAGYFELKAERAPGGFISENLYYTGAGQQWLHRKWKAFKAKEAQS